LFESAQIMNDVTSIIGDIRDYDSLKLVFDKYQPEIVIHMAAQPIVSEGYKEPRYTYETNVMGTINVLECIRNTNCVKSFINVTSDKVYENKEKDYAYNENDILNGFDPYSNSKSCSDLITNCYKNSFFANGINNIPVSTLRAGNVIGGGDFAKNRIIPDCINAIKENKNVILRSPDSVRPYQHVLDVLKVYLLVAKKQYEDINFAGCYNVGPDEDIKTSDLVERFINSCESNITWEKQHEVSFTESKLLKLDTSKIKDTFNWQPKLDLDKTIKMTADWYNVWLTKSDIRKCMEEQIKTVFDI